MKILFTSDLHGHKGAYEKFSALLKESDYWLGVIAGDLMTHVSPGEIDLVENDYKTVIDRMTDQIQQTLLDSGKTVLFIMGNDDGIIEGGIAWPEHKRLININGKRVNYRGYNFIGYQYTLPFVGGLYEKTEAYQKADFVKIGKKIDSKTVLVTHGPPQGILDDQEYGGVELRKMVDANPPMLHLFGHIHQSFGRNGIFINGSFPIARKFVGIDLVSKESSLIPITL